MSNKMYKYNRPYIDKYTKEYFTMNMKSKTPNEMTNSPNYTHDKKYNERFKKKEQNKKLT